ncbi:DUF590-domain-containing protein [Saitoella complicata NRRL Y-17804]|nr:DUF590-domain-containing protein [Saitoella complicata NRRL Y-17804]ODQ55723.1 DUF590-domain-containing protein [Saitoella complicata NRRL Y-17804]
MARPLSEALTSMPGLSGETAPDYVILFRPDPSSRQRTAAQLERLVRRIVDVGMRVKCEVGDNSAVLVMVRCPTSKLQSEAYTSRVKDWLAGIRIAAPVEETKDSISAEPMTPAERLRLVHAILTIPAAEGGVGITPNVGEWDLVASIFPIHDPVFGQSWLAAWSKRGIISDSSLTILKDNFGEKVAFLFAFTQVYFLFLGVPAVVGVIAHFFLPQYSIIYSLVLGSWSIVFVEMWRRKETNLAVRWGVHGCAKLEHRRAAFNGDKTVTDPYTGEDVPVFPVGKRILRQLLSVPIGFVAAITLAAAIMSIVATEILINEVYDGPGKNVLIYLPTVLFSTVVPFLSKSYRSASKKVTMFENHETDSSYEQSFTNKIFALNMLTSYMSLFITAYVYLPFGDLIVPKLDFLNLFQTSTKFTEKATGAGPTFQINSGRLVNQMRYMSITNNLVNFALELVVPFITKLIFNEAKHLRSKYRRAPARPTLERRGTVEEMTLNRVKEEAALDEYEIYGDYAEIVIQFGFVVLFSPVWPLAPVCFLINNWVELRSDAAKLCVGYRRPVPERADSIGPWVEHLAFVSWLGSITTSSLISIFRTGAHPRDASILGTLGIVLFAENLWLGTRFVVRHILKAVPPQGQRQLDGEKYKVRTEYLRQLIGEQAASAGDKKLGEAAAQEEDMGAFWRMDSGVEGVLQRAKGCMVSENKKTA